MNFSPVCTLTLHLCGVFFSWCDPYFRFLPILESALSSYFLLLPYLIISVGYFRFGLLEQYHPHIVSCPLLRKFKLKRNIALNEEEYLQVQYQISEIFCFLSAAEQKCAIVLWHHFSNTHYVGIKVSTGHECYVGPDNYYWVLHFTACTSLLR